MLVFLEISWTIMPSSMSPVLDFTLPPGPPSSLCPLCACAGSATASDTAAINAESSTLLPNRLVMDVLLDEEFGEMLIDAIGHFLLDVVATWQSLADDIGRELPPHAEEIGRTVRTARAPKDE